MAFFAKSASTPDALAQLTIDRVAAALDARECAVGWSSDRDSLGGFWGEHLVEFLFYGERGEVLQVRAHWGRPLPVARRAQVLDALNAHASSRLWPKAYVEVVDDELVVLAEHAVDYEHGVSDEQLDLHLATALNAALGLFETLDEAFPEAVEAHRAARAREADEDDDHDHPHDDDHDHPHDDDHDHPHGRPTP